MIIKEEFMNKLRRYFDLNLYEAKIWTALLSRGVSTAGELSDIANVPRSRTYDVLESLEKKGFVVIKLGKPIKYLAVSPDEVLERLKKRIDSEAKNRIDKVEELKESDIIEELNHLHTQGVKLVEPTEMSGSLKGRHNIYDHMDLLIRTAQEEIIISTTAMGLIRKVEGLKPSLEEAHRRGVEIKISAPINEENINYANEIKEFATIKNNELESRFIIVDKEQLLFMVANDMEVHPTYDLGIWINTPFFAKTLADLFELAWKDMKELGKK
ncbi:MAG: helix-turn-helix domain-containing protein [Candidatus Nanoarchaeia archaeon]|nr:helix-turn-helix domain-containing protein [Candidatus Nanoarchaeia archaeon]